MNPEAIAALLAERMTLRVEPELATALSIYLELLLRWNARTNLTAIRDSEGIVLRHFGESLVCARALPPGVKTSARLRLRRRLSRGHLCAGAA